MGQCQFCKLISCDRRMLVVFHGEFTLALGHGPQPSAVAKHLSQRNMCLNNDLISLCFTILNQSFSSVDIANDRSLELVWYPYLQEAMGAFLLLGSKLLNPQASCCPYAATCFHSDFQAFHVHLQQQVTQRNRRV